MKKLGVLIVHGMGKPAEDFAQTIIAEIEARLQELGCDPMGIEWQPVWWAPVLSSSQTDLWERSHLASQLHYKTLRRFVLHSLGDAVAYRQVSKAADDDIRVYDQIHAKVKKCIRELREKLRAGLSDDELDPPLFVMAHSIGGHIMSNYIWDRQKDSAVSLGNDFEDMKSLAAIVTFGCNIPLFTLAHKKIEPIAFPLPVARFFPEAQAPSIHQACRWWNYFDRDDILGWPLKPLSEAYDKAVHADVEINVGGVITSRTPMAHMKYWEDSNFTKPVASYIGAILKLLEPETGADLNATEEA